MRLLEEVLGILQSTFGQALEREPTALKPINPWQRRKKYGIDALDQGVSCKVSVGSLL